MGFELLEKIALELSATNPVRQTTEERAHCVFLTQVV